MKKYVVLLFLVLLLVMPPTISLLWKDVQDSLSPKKMVWTQRSLVLLDNEGFDQPEDVVDAEERLRRKIIPFWSINEALVATPYQYVKYGKGYQTRAVVDFSEGKVVIETVDQGNPVQALRECAFETLLTPASKDVDLYSDKPCPRDGEPFLYGQIQDEKGRFMRFGGRVSDYVDDVMKKGIQEREITVNGIPRTVRGVSMPMTDSHMMRRAKKYLPVMRQYSQRFGVPTRLLLAVAHVESSFNPFAVSSASAYGIMQVVPSSAGEEVHRFLRGKQGKPDRAFLFNPDSNIKYGAAYLHILHKKYFSGVTNAVSRELCSIAAYNGGPGAVLRTFGRTPDESCRAINGMDPKMLYRHLIQRLPSAETRRYVMKVVTAMKEYKNII